jgi:hypothetical protein
VAGTDSTARDADATPETEERGPFNTGADPAASSPGPAGSIRDPTAEELRFLAYVLAAIRERFPDGLPDFTDEEWRSISGRMAFTYPTNRSVPEIGPAFDTRSLAKFWDIPASTLLRRVADGTVFALKIKGRYLYPDFQLDPVGRVSGSLFDLIDVVRAFFDDDVQMAAWLSRWPTQPSPAHLLATGKPDQAFARAQELISQGKEDLAKKDGPQ